MLDGVTIGVATSLGARFERSLLCVGAIEARAMNTVTC